MKSKSFLYSMAAIVAMGLATSSCSEDLDSMSGVQNTALSTRAEASEQFGLTTVDLLAGQHNDAGDVKIWNDYGNVYVQVEMQNGWEMSHIHMFIGPKDVLLDPDNGYVNKNGSPKNGQFPINQELNPAITESTEPWTYTISLEELYESFGVTEETAEDVCPVIALHAEVSKNGQSETAWGNGINFVNKSEKKNGKGNGNSNGGGNWSMYIDNYCVTFPEETPEEPGDNTKYEYSYEGSETAWAKDNNNLEYNSGQGGNWATYIKYEGTEMTATLYAGQHNEAGTVTLEPADTEGKVKITFNIATEAPENEGEWVLNKDKGNELIKIQGYNKAPSGNPAPGQFKTYKGTETTIVVDQYSYYGIHLDMAKLVVTEVSEAAE